MIQDPPVTSRLKLPLTSSVTPIFRNFRSRYILLKKARVPAVQICTS